MVNEREKCLREVHELFYEKVSEATSKQTRKSVWHKKNGIIETEILSNINRLPGSRTLRDIFNETIKELKERGK